MTLYMAVTPDHLELPLFVTDSVHAMARWAGIKVSTVYQTCARNNHRPTPSIETKLPCKYRIRRIEVEEDE